jgi:hypothetical protein
MYTVYKIINTLNEKFYIGVHKTNNPNDGYFGSGKAIKEAIKLHGKENFKKEVLFVTENEQEAYSLEKKLTSDFSDRNNYNMRIGGIGGFTVENAKKGYIAAGWSKELLAENGRKTVKFFTKEQLSENGRKGGLTQKGKPKSEAHKEALRESWRKKKLLQ